MKRLIRLVLAALTLALAACTSGMRNAAPAGCRPSIYPDYTGVTRYPLGTEVEIWYCDATEADVERIISNFKVDSTQIFKTPYDEYEDYYTTEEDINSLIAALKKRIQEYKAR